MAVRSHSLLPPSAAERWWNCPGSISLCSTLLPGKSSSYSAEGNVAHSLAEELITGKTDCKTLVDRVGEVVSYGGFDIEITDEMVDGVFMYADTIKERITKLQKQGRATPVFGKAEVKVSAPSVDAEMRGTADYVLYQKGNLLSVFDFKYGKKAVEAKENKQLLIYALGAMEGEGAGIAFDAVELTIVQPRSSLQPPVRTWGTTAKVILSFKEELKKRVRATKRKGAKLEAGEWCRFCPASASCPTMFGEVQRQAQVDFAVVPSAPGFVPSLPDPRLIPIERVGMALAWEDAINSWYEALKMRVKGMLEAGEEVPGWKLVDGKSNRKWRDEEEVIKKFSPVLGETLWEKKLLSPAKLEKVVGKEEVAELTVKPPSSKAIAPASDPRPEARRTAEQDFAPDLTEIL